ncbi:50S ribosomal protein L7ae [bacterium 1xD8-48]|jgi:ribosomal protein L7Ae-like RNA K-turn-binding protein|nr:50S ribosomal protein L7ae [Lachnospiraceae bacterium]MCI9327419.1 50S ribosomal protein L7ae [Lachnospiraceae bacterium]NBJ99048.1 50S ribosomal protein L7ae [bacterium 1xD8-48]
MNDRVLSLLGLAAKGRNLRSGEFSTEKAVKEGSAAMVIIGNDASDNTKKKFTNMCAFYNTPIYFYSDKVQLGRAIGREMRTSVAVTDEGMAANIMKRLEES